MNPLIAKTILEAVAHYGDAAIDEFLRRLRERKLMTTRCQACRSLAFPPRSFCPSCHARTVEWVELPRQGTVYAFTSHDPALPSEHPVVLGLVDLPDAARVLGVIDASLDRLAIGQLVEVDFEEISPELVLHRFRPIHPLPGG